MISLGENCRSFDSALIPTDLDGGRLLGTWYPLFNSNHDKFGLNKPKRCPISLIEGWDLSKHEKNPLMKSWDLSQFNGFKLKTASFFPKVNFPSKMWFKGWMSKDKPYQGGLWAGILPIPLKKDDFDNLQVVATDYDNFAIFYLCSRHLSDRLVVDGDRVFVWSRFPSVEEMSAEGQSKLEEAFNSLFGQQEGFESYSWGEIESTFVVHDHSDCAKYPKV